MKYYLYQYIQQLAVTITKISPVFASHDL